MSTRGTRRSEGISSGHHHRFTPAQIGTKPSAAEQRLKGGDAFVAGPCEVLQPQAGIPESIVQLLGTFARVPLRLEFRQQPVDLAEVHAITAGIRAAILRVLDPASGNRLSHNLRQVPDLVILLRLSHVEGFAVYHFPWSIQHSDKGAGDVLNVHDRTPRSAIALDVNASRSQRPRHQIVEHEIEAQPGRYSVGGGVTKESWAEVRICQFGDILLYQDL